MTARYNSCSAWCVLLAVFLCAASVAAQQDAGAAVVVASASRASTPAITTPATDPEGMLALCFAGCREVNASAFRQACGLNANNVSDLQVSLNPAGCLSLLLPPCQAAARALRLSNLMAGACLAAIAPTRSAVSRRTPISSTEGSSPAGQSSRAAQQTSCMQTCRDIPDTETSRCRACCETGGVRWAVNGPVSPDTLPNMGGINAYELLCVRQHGWAGQVSLVLNGLLRNQEEMRLTLTQASEATQAQNRSLEELQRTLNLRSGETALALSAQYGSVNVLYARLGLEEANRALDVCRLRVNGDVLRELYTGGLVAASRDVARIVETRCHTQQIQVALAENRLREMRNGVLSPGTGGDGVSSITTVHRLLGEAAQACMVNNGDACSSALAAMASELMPGDPQGGAHLRDALLAAATAPVPPSWNQPSTTSTNH